MYLHLQDITNHTPRVASQRAAVHVGLHGDANAVGRGDEVVVHTVFVVDSHTTLAVGRDGGVSCVPCGGDNSDMMGQIQLMPWFRVCPYLAGMQPIGLCTYSVK